MILDTHVWRIVFKIQKAQPKLFQIDCKKTSENQKGYYKISGEE